MRCKACNTAMTTKIRTDQPEYDGILFEDLCPVCRNVAGVTERQLEYEVETGCDASHTPIVFSPSGHLTLDELEDLLNDWGIK